jgi:hypothetical protein
VVTVRERVRNGSAGSTSHTPHAGPAAGNVDGVGAGEAERFVEPDQLVLGGLQVRRCRAVVTVAQMGTEQGRGQTLSGSAERRPDGALPRRPIGTQPPAP